ncbi:hypothetical protein [Reichenbachiella sp.]|uniref:hypothetical protein n=1 Tax=Reichenbachiella sp. TaxID=2184521 RepID=UPI003B59C17D
MRVLAARNLLDKKDPTYQFDGVWQDVIGNPEKNGVWIIYGREKNGKTWFAVMLANYLSQHGRTLYISAEEGLGANFQSTCQRAGVSSTNKKLKFSERIELEDLKQKLDARHVYSFVIIDNITVYRDDLKRKAIDNLIKSYPKVIFIFLAHEKNNEPFTAPAQLAKILSKVIIRVEGLACYVSGRCPGGTLMIDEEKAMLYHGSEIKTKKK